MCVPPPPPHLSLEVGGIAGRHVGVIGSGAAAACLSPHLFLGWQRCGQEKQLWHVTAHSEVSALPGCAVAALAVKGPQRRELWGCVGLHHGRSTAGPGAPPTFSSGPRCSCPAVAPCTVRPTEMCQRSSLSPHASVAVCVLFKALETFEGSCCKC